MHLLNKRILFLNSDDSLHTEVNNTRGDLWIPIPQQFQDPAATDLIFKMYIQSLTLHNDVVNVDEINNSVSVYATFTSVDGTVHTLVNNETLKLPSHNLDENTLVELITQTYGGTYGDYAGPTRAVQRFTVEFTSAAREKVVYPGPEGRPNSAVNAGGYNIQPTKIVGNNANRQPTIVPYGNQLFALVYDVEDVNNVRMTPDDNFSIAYQEISTLQFTFTCQGRADTLLGFPSDQPYTIYPFSTASHVTPESDGYNEARKRAAAPNPLLLNDFTELHVKTDLPVTNFEVTSQGLTQTRTTTVIPVGAPGSVITYFDNDGVYAAYERNQSTITRIHIYLEDKYGRPVLPKSAWTFTLAIETHQDDFKRMIDILLASKSFHESALAMHKLQLVGASFTALE